MDNVVYLIGGFIAGMITLAVALFVIGAWTDMR